MERVLVVDDEPNTVRVLKDFLTLKEYEVYTASSGMEAIEKVREVRPHIVLLDIIMPGMGGIDTLREIKSINPKIAVIMITAVIDEELAKRAMQLGADEYITKPIDLFSVETAVMVKTIQLLG